MRELKVRANERFLCNAEVAQRAWKRGLGLLGRKQLPADRGLLIPRCRSIHTMFMRFSIDAVYLDGSGSVVKAERRLRPFRLSTGGHEAHSVLELPAGFLEDQGLGVGEVLKLAEPVPNAPNAPGQITGGEQPTYGNGARYRIFQPDRLVDGAPGWIGAAGNIATFALGVLLSPLLFFGLGLFLGTWGIEKFLVRPFLDLASKVRGLGRRRASGGKKNVPTRNTAEMAISALTSRHLQGTTSKVVGPRVSRIGTDETFPGPSNGTYLIISGQDEALSIRIGQEPETIGTAQACSIRLPLAPGVAGEHARIWWRDGQLMLHHLAEGLSTMVNRKDVGWSSLREGDEIWIGPYLLRVSGEPTAPELFTPLERASLVNEERREIGTGIYPQSM